MKKILIFSYNPVPTKQYTTIEGSALRFWRMAQALRERGYHDITIAVWSKFPQTTSRHKGIKLVNFNDNPQELKALCRDYDVTIFTCAMGKLSLDIQQSVDPRSRVIIDAYSPMYVEFLTKSPDTAEDDALVEAYRSYADAFDRLLISADHILIANDNQKHFYRGVLGGISALPDHDDTRFVTYPAFVEYDKDVTERSNINDVINILWFGGVYPWFDIADVISAFEDPWIRKHARLTIVGGSNPFYPKDNLRYNGKYIAAVDTAHSKGLYGKSVFFEDWVEYNNRVAEVFNKADIAISINSNFIENDYSFRLRVADLVGNGVPILTNGGDFLGERLISDGVAFRLNLNTVDDLKESLKQTLKNKKLLENARKLLRANMSTMLHIDGYIDQLIMCIESEKPLQKKIAENVYLDAYRISQQPYTQMPMYNLSLDDVRFISTKKLISIVIQRLRKTGKDRIKRLAKE